MNPCPFNFDVMCAFKKSAHSYVMNRCFKCKVWKEFCDRMERFENEFFEECERIRKYGYDAHVEGGS